MDRACLRSKAFTLVELVLTIAIIAILSAIAEPRYANSLALYRSQVAAQRIVADLNFARWQARSSSSGQSIVFNTSNNSYSLPGAAGLSGQPSPYTVNLSSEPYNATLLTASFGAGAALSFDRYGQPSSGGMITLASGTAQRTITVDPNTGLGSVQ
jgi:prepilin-type N-terminal cleavage/methylation domain-containing protein